MTNPMASFADVIVTVKSRVRIDFASLENYGPTVRELVATGNLYHAVEAAVREDFDVDDPMLWFELCTDSELTKVKILGDPR